MWKLCYAIHEVIILCMGMHRSCYYYLARFRLRLGVRVFRYLPAFFGLYTIYRSLTDYIRYIIIGIIYLYEVQNEKTHDDEKVMRPGHHTNILGIVILHYIKYSSIVYHRAAVNAFELTSMTIFFISFFFYIKTVRWPDVGTVCIMCHSLQYKIKYTAVLHRVSKSVYFEAQV